MYVKMKVKIIMTDREVKHSIDESKREVKLLICEVKHLMGVRCKVEEKVKSS